MEQTSSVEPHYVTEGTDSKKKKDTGFHIIGLYSLFALYFTLAFAVLG